MTPAEREARILSLERQVNYLARRKYALLPFRRIQLDELISAAWLGAIRAVDSFDETAGNKLSTYADWKIASAIADYLRSLDPLTRIHRRAVNRDEAEPIYFLQQGRPEGNSRDKPGPIARAMDGGAARAQVALDARITLEAIMARAQLSARSAKILRLWSEGGLMKEIGLAMTSELDARLHLSESRVSQICSESIAKLRLAA
ncbi:MAG: sigma-70 family RNA polymerase sigma factor [Pseudomonadota bacterium]